MSSTRLLQAQRRPAAARARAAPASRRQPLANDFSTVVRPPSVLDDLQVRNLCARQPAAAFKRVRKPWAPSARVGSARVATTHSKVAVSVQAACAEHVQHARGRLLALPEDDALCARVLGGSGDLQGALRLYAAQSSGSDASLRVARAIVEHMQARRTPCSPV